jgi:hypothetical protein
MLEQDIFKDDNSYWMIADEVKGIYMSDGSISTLVDFERVLDEVDIYAFKNWIDGEFVGMDIGRYTVTAKFMWPETLMPDPRGAKRLIPFDCRVKFLKTALKVPAKVESYDDFEAGTKKPKLVDQTVWVVEIEMPKELMYDIRTGSVELEGQDIDLEELDAAYEQDLDKADTQTDEDDTELGTDVDRDAE